MIITHSGRFHADEVFATAIILLLEDREVIRTRDQAQIEKGEIVLDVGGIYDPSQLRFDHHQNSFTRTRENGIPYATAGIVWEHFGADLLKKRGLEDDYERNYALQWIDQKLIADVDAVDNGYYAEDARPSVSLIIAMMNQSRDEEQQYHAFLKAITFTTDIMNNFIAAAIKEAKVVKELESLLPTVDKQGILVLNKDIAFKDFLRTHPEIKRVVYPRGEDQYGVFCNEKHNHLPERFRGLREEELAEVSGLKDAIFCHKSGFMAVCSSQESALTLAKSI